MADMAPQHHRLTAPAKLEERERAARRDPNTTMPQQHPSSTEGRRKPLALASRGPEHNCLGVWIVVAIFVQPFSPSHPTPRTSSSSRRTFPIHRDRLATAVRAVLQFLLEARRMRQGVQVEGMGLVSLHMGCMCPPVSRCRAAREKSQTWIKLRKLCSRPHQWHSLPARNEVWAFLLDLLGLVCVLWSVCVVCLFSSAL
ncbi:hypothetical protein EV356DRAFT_316540 [Viridothelium virens]|uniref:Uncharacterized protein n=1 Tax=Viridothelium virens TaxID=1048519 RepID=A0A6A6GZG9_VIRVR|nr:hypothetical protein EV356DRAFT_316540 [Viridothelium virens]